MPRLTEQGQQELIRFVEADKPLPDKYRFVFFEDQREVELACQRQDERSLQYRPTLPSHRVGGRAARGKARPRQPDGPAGKACCSATDYDTTQQGGSNGDRMVFGMPANGRIPSAWLSFVGMNGKTAAAELNVVDCTAKR